ncbi:hypothetical protein C8F01DRAFT_1083508 [Mycena amicta]|nr:hypothetical protein C8F01DRAFT_1083508 [Mycena amicta]
MALPGLREACVRLRTSFGLLSNANHVRHRLPQAYISAISAITVPTVVRPDPAVRYAVKYGRTTVLYGTVPSPTLKAVKQVEGRARGVKDERCWCSGHKCPLQSAWPQSGLTCITRYIDNNGGGAGVLAEWVGGMDQCEDEGRRRTRIKVLEFEAGRQSRGESMDVGLTVKLGGPVKRDSSSSNYMVQVTKDLHEWIQNLNVALRYGVVLSAPKGNPAAWPLRERGRLSRKRALLRSFLSQASTYLAHRQWDWKEVKRAVIHAGRWPVRAPEEN